MSFRYSWDQAFIILVVYRLFHPFLFRLWLGNHIDHLSLKDGIFIRRLIACRFCPTDKHSLKLVLRTYFLVDIDLRESQRLYAAE